MESTAAPASFRKRALEPWTAGRAALLLVLSMAAVSASAQLGTPGNAPAASSPQGPAPLRRQPNLTGPADAERSMDLNNEKAGGKVVPQLQIPLGKRAGGPVIERRRPAPAAASAPGSLIHDSAARCESETDKGRRAACLGLPASP